MSFRIFSYLSPRALGDAILFALFTNSVADMFDDSDLVVYYREDRPYKAGIASCIRNAKRVLKPSKPGAMLPIELFDTAGWAPKVQPELQTIQVRGPNLILTHTMFAPDMLNSIPLSPLAPPPETISTSNQALMELGLDPARWIATVYWKEPSYLYRPWEPWREITDPAPYIAAIRHIVDGLGGQVVRLGHPTPTALPNMRGLVDLAHVPNSEWLQLYAVWVSRFMLSSVSGPLSYGTAFNVPTVATDQRTYTSVYQPHDYIITQKRLFGGKAYQGYEAFAAGLLKDWGKDPNKYINNTAEELIAAADEMYNSTVDCTGWRVHRDPPLTGQRPNRLHLPIPEATWPMHFIPPSQRSKVAALRTPTHA